MRNNLGRVNAHADVARLRAGLGARSAPSNVITLPTFEDAIAGRQRLHMVDAREYGASPSASAVSNTAAIQAALNDANGGALYLADGIYEISPTTGTIFALPGSVRIIGNGKGKTILKVADGVGAFDYVFVDTSHDVSGLTIADLTIDMNVDNNPIANLTQIMTHARYAVSAGSGAPASKITLQNVEVKNNSSVNTIVTTAALSDVTVRGCTFIQKADPNAVAHDHSTIYLISTYNHISDNYFEGDALPATVSASPIEIHGSHSVIANNRICQYSVGANLTGVSQVGDTLGTIFSHNVLDRMSVGGVLIWSYQYLTHTTGYGVDGLVIDNNVIHISQTAEAAGTASYGIAVEPNSDLPVRNILIANNTLIWEKEVADRDANSASFGIGFYSTTNVALENCQIVDNVVENMPMAAIRLSCAVVNVRVADNTFRNCGSTLHAETAAYRTPFCIVPYTLQDLVISNNTIIDDFSTTRIPYAFYINAPVSGTASGFQVLDNSINIVGATKTAYQYDYAIAALAGVFGRGRLTDGYAAPTYGILPGSEWIDQSRKMKYICVSANTLIQEAYGLAAPTTGAWLLGSRVWSYVPTAGYPPGWVCVTGGTPGTWKAMANLAA